MAFVFTMIPLFALYVAIPTAVLCVDFDLQSDQRVPVGRAGRSGTGAGGPEHPHRPLPCDLSEHPKKIH